MFAQNVPGRDADLIIPRAVEKQTLQRGREKPDRLHAALVQTNIDAVDSGSSCHPEMRAMKKLRYAFFRKPAIELAQDLVGTILVHRWRGRERRARIVETEAYVGAHDKACHAFKGRTQRTEIMFGPAGRAYVYLIYGMYNMLNIVAGDLDDPQAVLIRGAMPLDDWQADLSGPGKLARALQITRAHNGLDLTGSTLFLQSDAAGRPTIAATPRIGIDYAEEWKDVPLRFVDTAFASA
jgi:DNA-3-methyladenine glycosylase